MEAVYWGRQAGWPGRRWGVGGQILKRGGAEEESTRTQERRRKRSVLLQVRMLEYLKNYHISIINVKAIPVLEKPT